MSNIDVKILERLGELAEGDNIANPNRGLFQTSEFVKFLSTDNVEVTLDEVIYNVKKLFAHGKVEASNNSIDNIRLSEHGYRCYLQSKYI